MSMTIGHSVAIGPSPVAYCVEEEHIVLLDWQGTAGEANVPAQVEGRSVTALAKKCFLGKRQIRKISLPDTIEEIGDYCFAQNPNLEEVCLPGKKILLGKTPFLNCKQLKRIEVRGRETAVSELVALAAVDFGAVYLLDFAEAGSLEWYRKWDMLLQTELNTSDLEGHTHAVLCGEEDYESTDQDKFMSEKRYRKARHCLVRLMHPACLEQSFQKRLEDYLCSHTKGKSGEEAWEVVREEFGNDKACYSLFEQIGCVTRENLDAILEDLGEEYPEMKAYFLRSRIDTTGEDFFDALDL